MKKLLLLLSLLVCPLAFAGQNVTGILYVNGNIGVGSTNPGMDIDVQGSVRALGYAGIQVADVPILNQNTSGNAATVTTNANLTGPITSSGNTTSIASQTGTGSTFVMNTSPILVTPALGTPSSGVATNLTGTASGLTAGTVSTINGLISQGTNVTITGSGTSGSPYNISSSGGSGGGSPGLPSGSLQYNQSGSFSAANVYQDGNGNVGIGSTLPGTALDVQGTTRMIGFTMATGAANTNVLTSDANGNGTWQPAGAGSSQWTTVNTNDVFLPNSGSVGIGTSFTTTSALTVMNGNVGIGTWLPGAPLHIQSTSGVFPLIIQRGSGAYSFGPSATMTGDTTDFVISPVSGQTSAGIAFYSRTGSGSQISTLGIDKNGNIGVGTISPIAGMAVMSGNVGIGTWIPTSALQIGAGTSGTTITNNGTITTGGINLSNTASTINGTSAAAGSSLTIRGGQSTTSILNLKSTGANGTTDNINFLMGNNGATNAMILADNAGSVNVGIGTALPGVQLDVNGTIRASEFSAQSSGTILCVKTGGGIGYCSGVIAGISCTCN